MKKFFAIAGSLFLLLLTALSFYVRSDAFSARIRPVVETAVADALGPSVRFGTVRANLLPPYLEVRDIVISGRYGRPAATIRKIRGYVNPLPLLLRTISVPRIVIIEPRISLVRNADGTHTLSDLINRIMMKRGEARPDRPVRKVSLRTIAITRGTLSFLEAPAGRSYRIDQFAGAIRMDRGGVGARLRVTSGIVTAAAGPLAGISLSLQGEARAAAKGIDITAFDVRFEDAVLSVTGSAVPSAGGALSLKLRGRAGPKSLVRLALPSLEGERTRRFSATIVGEIRGSAAEPDVEGAAELRGIPAGAMTIANAPLSFTYRNSALRVSAKSIVMTRGTQRLVIDRADLALTRKNAATNITRCEIEAGDLAARLTGRVLPGGEVDAVLSVESEGEGTTLGFLTTVPLGGRLSSKGLLSGTLASPRFDGVVSAWPLVVRGKTFDEIGGKVRYEDRTLSLAAVHIQQASSRFTLDGDITFSKEAPMITARLTIDRGDAASVVGLFYRPLPLEIIASGEVTFRGTPQEFRASGHLTADHGSAYGETFDGAAVSVAVTRSEVSFPQVVAHKGGGIVKASGRIRFDGSYEAQLESNDVDLGGLKRLAGFGYAGLFRADVSSSGTFRAPTLSAVIDVPRLTAKGSVIGSLAAKADIENGVLSVTAEVAEKMTQVSGRLSLRPPFDWTLETAAAVEDLDPFLLAGSEDLVGRATLGLDGQIALRGRGKDLKRLNGSARFRKFSAVVGDYRLDADGEPSFDLKDGTVVLRGLSLVGTGTRFSVTGSADLLEEYDIALAGTANLSLLRLIFDAVDHGSGEVTAAIAVRGPWKRPAISGQVRLVSGEIKIKDVPQKFSDLTGTVEFDQDRIVTEDLKGSFGGGRVIVSGWVDLAGFSLKDFSTRTIFDDVTVRFPEGPMSTLSGELSYEGDRAGQGLSGDVRIRRARYEKRVDWKSMLVEMGRGFSRPRKPDTGWIGMTGLNLRFQGKENILLRNNLANIPLEIDVMLRGTVAQPQLLGRVEARKGVVYLRRNDFSILRATIGFFDPNRINPSLDIQAETRVRQYDIRLAVTGTADRAQMTFLSDPPLSENDILSLLALGKTGTEMRGIEGSVGMGEAASFATGQFQDVFEQRARSITGLDRVQVDPYVGKGDTSVPRITVGKEIIKDRLYFTYSTNVNAEPEQAFRFEYLMGKRLSLVGEGNEEGNFGADVKFRFEFR